MGFPHSSVGKESVCNAGNPGSWVRKICWRRDRLLIPVFLGFPDGSAGKESVCSMGDLGSIPGLGRSPRKGIGYLLWCSWVSLVAQSVKNPPAMLETWVRSLDWEDSPGGGHGKPLQYSCLENPHGQRSLVGCSPWGHKDLDSAE